MTLTADFSVIPVSLRTAEIGRLGDTMQAAGQAGYCPPLTVERPWSEHSADAQAFYAVSRRQHVEIGISVAEKVRQLCPGGLPATDLRSPDEPLLGISGPEAIPGPGDAPSRR